MMLLPRIRRSTLAIATLLLFACEPCTFGYDILFLLPISAQSHRNVFNPLISALVEKGHNMTVYSAYPDKSRPMVREVFMKNVRKIYEDTTIGAINHFEGRKHGVFRHIYKALSTLSVLCEVIVHQEPLLMMLRDEKPKYDIVIYDGIMNECVHGFSKILDVPTAMVLPLGTLPWVDSRIGIPDISSVNANFFGDFTSPMPFGQRLQNTILNVFTFFVYDFVYLPQVWRSSKAFFGEHTPSPSDIIRETSLFLANTHVSSRPAASLPPGVVEVGGIQTRPPKPLPQDLDRFAASSGDKGFIYFSLGSVAKSSAMPEEMRLRFVEAFKRIDMKILWKWETDSMMGKPDNVKLANYVPQQDVLGHPKCKLFITHGGLLSQEEAVYHAVPMVVLPLFADQDLNARQAEQLAIGTLLEITTFTPEELVAAVKKVLSDRRYKENILERSRISRDRPMHPKDLAVWWIEYVIRHKGAEHLKLASRHLYYHQYFMLDILAFLAVVILSFLWILRLVVRMVFGGIASKMSSAGRQSSSQNGIGRQKCE